MKVRSIREALALAADVPLAQSLAVAEKVSEHVGVVKVGLSLFVEHGPLAVTPFIERGFQVFLDLKLHDIPNTVRLAAEKAGRLGVRYLTVHASGGEAMLQGALEGAAAGAKAAGHTAPVLLAVTVLTSTDDALLGRLGVQGGALENVERLGTLAKRAGLSGVVCSPREAAAMRALMGPDACVCTPGVRLTGGDAGDQARVETPAFALQQGASLLVVGRPIYADADPVAAARAITHDMSNS